MENNVLSDTFNNLPELVKHTHLNIQLQGWSAAVSVISGCLTLVAICAIRSHPLSANPQSEGTA